MHSLQWFQTFDIHLDSKFILWDTSILRCHTETYDCFEYNVHNVYIVNIPQLHIENQGSEGQFGEISCENGFSRQFRRRYTVLGFDK